MKLLAGLLTALSVLAVVCAPLGVSADTHIERVQDRVPARTVLATKVKLHINLWAQAHEDFVPNTERTTLINVPDHECAHKYHPKATFCSVCLTDQIPGLDLPDCGHRHDTGVTWIWHYDQYLHLICPVSTELYKLSASPIDGFTESEHLRDRVCTPNGPSSYTPKCNSVLREGGYYVGDDQVTVNIGRLGHYGPDDLTVEVRWSWSGFSANDKLPPYAFSQAAPKVVGKISQQQGHRVFYEDHPERGGEIVYLPKRWAAGTDWFVYNHGGCEGRVEITFSDYKPVAERVSVRPELDERRNADEWSWAPSDIAHRHYGWDWKWKQDCDPETTSEHFCKLWYQTYDDVKDQWEYQKHGTVVTHRYEGGFYRVSGVGETIETLQNLSDDWDWDLWKWEGFLFSDPETGVLPPLDVSEATKLAGYAVRSDTVGPAAGIVKTSPINYPHDYSQFYDFGWTPTGETPILAWAEPPGPKHRTSHDNYPAAPPGVIEDPPYSNSWRWEQTDGLSNTMLRRCHLTSGRAQVNPGDGGAWICFVWRNKTGDIDFASPEQHITVPYWVCDLRAEGYFADRAAARAAGFTAHDYCSEGEFDIGHAPLSRRLYPN